jgi:hypothetical protein
MLIRDLYIVRGILAWDMCRLLPEQVTGAAGFTRGNAGAKGICRVSRESHGKIFAGPQ